MVMSIPGSYEYGPDREGDELFGPGEVTHPLDEDPEAATGIDDDLPPDPAIDERDLLEPPS
jgi:hypothetical protein